MTDTLLTFCTVFSVMGSYLLFVSGKAVTVGSVLLLASVSASCACAWSGAELQANVFASAVSRCPEVALAAGPYQLAQAAAKCVLLKTAVYGAPIEPEFGEL